MDWARRRDGPEGEATQGKGLGLSPFLFLFLFELFEFKNPFQF
jgi:hypothetical protein